MRTIESDTSCGDIVDLFFRFCTSVVNDINNLQNLKFSQNYEENSLYTKKSTTNIVILIAIEIDYNIAEYDINKVYFMRHKQLFPLASLGTVYLPR